MVISQRKFSIISLALYWPVLIILAHIRIPESVRSAHVSDKSLHFLAYLVLAFLLWFSVKPGKKVHWRKKSVWFILFALTAYGAADEVVQSYIGRSCDAMDVAANFTGVLFGLILLTFLTFYPAALIIIGVVIFSIANIARANLSELFPVVYGVFHFFAYAIFTACWLLNRNLLFPKKPSKFLKMILSIGVPLFFLLIVKISSAMLGRSIAAHDFLVPAAAIITVTAASLLKDLYSGRLNRSEQMNSSVSP